MNVDELIEYAQANNISMEEIMIYLSEKIPANIVLQEFRRHLDSRSSDSEQSPPLRPATIQTYKHTLRVFEEYCSISEPDMKLSQVQIMAEKFLEVVAKENQLQTVHKHATALRSLLRFIEKTYRLRSKELRTEGYENLPEPTVLTHEQIKLLFSVAKRQTYGHRYVFMLEFLLYSGLWRSEFLSLKLKNVDFENNKLHVEDGRGGSSRTVSMPSFFLNECRSYFGMMGITDPEHHLFGQRAEPWKPMSPGNCDGIFRTISRAVQKVDPTFINVNPLLLRNTNQAFLYVAKWLSSLENDIKRGIVEPNFKSIRQLIDAAL